METPEGRRVKPAPLLSSAIALPDASRKDTWGRADTDRPQAPARAQDGARRLRPRRLGIATSARRSVRRREQPVHDAGEDAVPRLSGGGAARRQDALVSRARRDRVDDPVHGEQRTRPGATGPSSQRSHGPGGRNARRSRGRPARDPAADRQRAGSLGVGADENLAAQEGTGALHPDHRSAAHRPRRERHADPRSDEPRERARPERRAAAAQAPAAGQQMP